MTRKGTAVIEHHIQVDNARPIRKPQYRVPYSLREEMKTQIENMFQNGVIRESNFPWAAPALLVPKRSTDGKPKFRFCVDFRALNSVTKFDTYPLRVFDAAISIFHSSKYYSVLDCYSGFWQINIKEEHKEKTGFSVPSGHYEFNRLPVGLTNRTLSFQRLMDIVLKNLVGTECFFFVDYVIIFSKSAQEHALRMENVPQRFDRANLQLHPGKFIFAQPQVNYLGFVLSEQGVAASPDKIKAVKNYTSPRKLRTFEHFWAWLRFIENLWTISPTKPSPFTEVT